MYQVEDDPKEEEPIETIHLYVVREGEKRPSLIPVLISILALFILLAIGILTPYKQPETRGLIRVPAVLMPLKTYTASVAVNPTGVKTYPATEAHGTLTIANGSILTEELPKGMILTSKDGVEVATDEAVTIPAGNPPAYGIATVSVHTVLAGSKGNIQALDIDTIEGTSLFIRNVQAFSGGADSYSVKYITQQDRENALSKARSSLLPQTLSGLLESPCKEIVTGSQVLHISWTCQFVSYSVPNLLDVKVLHAEVRGKIILLDVVYVARPRILTTK